MNDARLSMSASAASAVRLARRFVCDVMGRVSVGVRGFGLAFSALVVRRVVMVSGTPPEGRSAKPSQDPAVVPNRPQRDRSGKTADPKNARCNVH